MFSISSSSTISTLFAINPNHLDTALTTHFFYLSQIIGTFRSMEFIFYFAIFLLLLVESHDLIASLLEFIIFLKLTFTAIWEGLDWLEENEEFFFSSPLETYFQYSSTALWANSYFYSLFQWLLTSKHLSFKEESEVLWYSEDFWSKQGLISQSIKQNLFSTMDLSLASFSRDWSSDLNTYFSFSITKFASY